MRKILIVILFCACYSLGAQTGLPHGEEMSALEKWQLKGYYESALRMNDRLQATAFLAEWHRREPQNDEVTFNLGRLYYQIRNYAMAEDIMRELFNKDQRHNLNALYYYALVRMHYRNYEEAFDYFSQLRGRYRRIGEKSVTRDVIDQLLIGCEMGMAARDTMVTTEVTLLSDSINTSHSEAGIVLINDTTFVYGSTTPDAPTFHELNKPYVSVQNFYGARLEDDEWTGKKKVDPPFFTYGNFDTGYGCFSVDGQRFYFTQCANQPNGKNICHIYMSHKAENGVWSAPLPLDKDINHVNYTATQPAVGSCFDNNLEVLYFVSDRPGGAGGMDIWYSVYNKNKKTYTKAANAGVFINTSGDEITPFYDLPSHKLFFSSNGRGGFGGFDIYRAEGNMVTWEPAENIGLPINSSFDDLNFVRNRSGQFGLFTSNRPGSRALYYDNCCDDIYAFRETKAPRVLITGKLVREDQISSTLSTVDSLNEPSPLKQNVLMNKVVSVEMLSDSASSVFLQEVTTNEKGEFELWVDPGRNYKINVADSTLLDRSFMVSTREVQGDETIELSTVALSEIPEKSIVLENIYYRFDQTELTSQAKETLERTILKLMNQYPQITIEISAHTDSLGDASYNQKLSEGRAGSVVDYLVSKGISSNRLSARGYGASHPIAPNTNADGTDNPEGRRRNRRTEFRITGTMKTNIIGSD